MKKILLISLFLIGSLAYGELRLRIHEPIRFENVNTKAVGDVVVGQGSIEVFLDDLENDRNKKFIFKFPKKGLMTNKKRWVEIDKYIMEDSDKEFKMTRDKKIVKIYAVIERRKLNSQFIDGEDLQGEYIGYVPIIVEQYGRPINKVETPENKPIVLPEFPDAPATKPMPLSSR